MKNIILTILVVLIIVPLATLYAGKAGEKKGEFTGIVISFSDEYIELKKGKTEVKLYRDAETVVENATGDRSQDSVNLCQKARAEYVKENSKARLVKLRIIKPGYCGN